MINVFKLLFFGLLLMEWRSPVIAGDAHCDIIDVGLVIDSSDKFGEDNFNQVRSFLQIFIDVLNICQNATRIAAIQVTNKPVVLWDLSESYNSSVLVEQLHEMRFLGGQQRLGLAFDYLTKNTFAERNGGRPNVPDVVVIFTGGAAPKQTLGKRLKKNGVHVVVINVGAYTDLKWKQLASEPVEDNFFTLASAFRVVLLLQDPTIASCRSETSSNPQTTPRTVTLKKDSPSTPYLTRSLPTPGPAPGHIINPVSPTISEKSVVATSSRMTTTTTTMMTTTTLAASLKPSIFIDDLDYSQGLPSTCPLGSWTPWYNSDDPSGEGDDETLTTLRSLYPDVICESPIHFEARIASTGTPLNSSADNVFASRLMGLECVNFVGVDCDDYEVRFCCPKVSSSFSTLSNFGKAVTEPAISSSKAFVTSSAKKSTTEGSFKEKKPDASSCPSGGWTRWYNSDDPQGYGDDETLQTLRSLHPGVICEVPTSFEARVASTGIPLNSSAANVFASRTTGLECLNLYGVDCEDYEVRFCCPTKGFRCFVGKTTDTPNDTLPQNEMQCGAGELCADVTATVLRGEGRQTDVTSVGMCLPPSQCSNFECDFLRNQLPYDVAEVLNCEARCCSGDRCNRHESGIHGTENPKLTKTAEPGLKCFTGVEVKGSLDLSQYGIVPLDLVLVECQGGEVCSDRTATISLATKSATVRQSLCLPPVACDSSNCDFINALLPESLNVDFFNCSSRCCDGDACNAPDELLPNTPPNVPIVHKPKLATSSPAATKTPEKKLPESNTASTIRPSSRPPSFFYEDRPFLPRCSVTQTLSSVLWCESLMSTPRDYKGPNTCRNKVKEVARCVEKQITWCMTGKKKNVLDALQLPNFNSQKILSLLHDATTLNRSPLNKEINKFCFHAGHNYPFKMPVQSHIDGCYGNFLTELRDQAKTFYYSYTWAENSKDICRAYRNFQKWFINSTSLQCRFDTLNRQGYSFSTSMYLETLVQIAVRTIKKMEFAACQDYRGIQL